jgi:hypothetical protein
MDIPQYLCFYINSPTGILYHSFRFQRVDGVKNLYPIKAGLPSQCISTDSFFAPFYNAKDKIDSRGLR